MPLTYWRSLFCFIVEVPTVCFTLARTEYRVGKAATSARWPFFEESVRLSMPMVTCTMQIVAHRLRWAGEKVVPSGLAQSHARSQVLDHFSLSGWGEAFTNGQVADQRLAIWQMPRPWAPAYSGVRGLGPIPFLLVWHPACFTTGRAVSSSQLARPLLCVSVLWGKYPPSIRSGLRLVGVFARVPTQALSPRRRRGKQASGRVFFISLVGPSA